MAETVLATHDLRKSFGALAATDGVSIDLRAGEIHAIIGPNGAGKSTLIAQICGALRPDAGRVAFLGQDVTGLSTQARARMGLARTFQTSALAMEDTVLQNVLLGALGASGRPWQFFGRASRDGALRDRAEAALEAVDLAELSELRTAELSHGQRRQLEVAVALTLAPRAFVMLRLILNSHCKLNCTVENLESEHDAWSFLEARLSASRKDLRRNKDGQKRECE